MIGQHPFSVSVHLTQDPLNVLRDVIRQMKATDQISDDRKIKRLGMNQLKALWYSDVVMTITNAEMPETLAQLCRDQLAEILDRLIHVEEYQRIEAQRIAQHYEAVPTYGMF